MPDGAQAVAMEAGRGPSVVDEILLGLSGSVRTLPAKLFYDEEGCRLFGQITRLDTYYVTRAEQAVLENNGAAIVEAAPADALVEYGAADETKAEFLLRHGAYTIYVPIDIAPSALSALRLRLAGARPTLAVHPVVADFTQPFARPGCLDGARVCGFFPGSTIGNFEPATVVAFLSRARGTLRCPDGAARFVVGTDLRKEASRLLPAYDDPQGVTAAFNLNMLTHVNRLAAANFDLLGFEHRAVFDEARSRIEMHLVSKTDQRVVVAGRAFDFEAGEHIHTENSYKHSRDGFLALAMQAGWRGAGFWTDPDGLFGVHLLETIS